MDERRKVLKARELGRALGWLGLKKEGFGFPYMIELKKDGCGSMIYRIAITIGLVLLLYCAIVERRSECSFAAVR